MVTTVLPGPSSRASATAPATLMPDDRPRHRPSSIISRCTHCTPRSEEHTSELQSLMRLSYAVFCLKKKKNSTRIASANFTNFNNETTRGSHDHTAESITL